MTDELFSNVYLVQEIIGNDPAIWFKMVQVSRKFAQWSRTDAAASKITLLKNVMRFRKTVTISISSFHALMQFQLMSGMGNVHYST